MFRLLKEKHTTELEMAINQPDVERFSSTIETFDPADL